MGCLASTRCFCRSCARWNQTSLGVLTDSIFQEVVLTWCTLSSQSSLMPGSASTMPVTQMLTLGFSNVRPTPAMPRSRTFNTVAELTEAQGACCAACSAAAGQCSGWTLSAARDNSSTARTCQLITGDPIEWHGAQKTQGCTAAYAEPDAYACWYSDPQFNTSFASVCDPSKCTCNAISNMSVGREQHAMCWHHSSQTASSTPQAVRIAHEKHSKWFEYVGGLGCLTDGTWYSTRAEGECKGDVVDESCWWRLAQQHRTVNASCVDDHVVAAVQKQWLVPV